MYIYIYIYIYAVPEPWVSRYDEASNHYFFWNTVTGATTWSKPPFPEGFPDRYAACPRPRERPLGRLRILEAFVQERS